MRGAWARMQLWVQQRAALCTPAAPAAQQHSRPSSAAAREQPQAGAARTHGVGRRIWVSCVPPGRLLGAALAAPGRSGARALIQVRHAGARWPLRVHARLAKGAQRVTIHRRHCGQAGGGRRAGRRLRVGMMPPLSITLRM